LAPVGIPVATDNAVIPFGLTDSISTNEFTRNIGFIEMRGILDRTQNGKITVKNGIYIVGL
jgi:hypothetical protein